MNENAKDDLLPERERIAREYARRRAEVDEQIYAPWQDAAALNWSSRRRLAAHMLKDAGVFPKGGARALEVGCGQLGWLSDLLAFGVRERDLSGIDLDEPRVAEARELLPSADLRVGDASSMPFGSESFDLVVASTVFTSILSDAMRRSVAGEIVRVLKPGAAILWYDFAFDNPRNRNVRGVGRKEMRVLFPTLKGQVKSVTLAPPLARLVAPRSYTLATVLEAVPFLRTHLMAVLVKS